MLKKLLKYDFRANLKIFLFIWPAIIVFALLERVVIYLDSDAKAVTVLINLITSLYVLAIVAACIFALVVSVTRFYSGLLKDEGYLMFTLPVRPWQLILSKFVTAFATCAITITLSVFSLSLIAKDPLGSLRDLFYSDSSFMTTGNLILCIVMLACALATELLKIYLACAVGHLARSKRVLFSVLFYYGLNVLVEVVTVSIVMVCTSTPIADGIDHFLASFTPAGCIALGFSFLSVVLAVIGCIYFFVTERILRKHLNLE